MLPEALSNGICSLNPREDRLTKTACIEYSFNGEVIGSRFFNSVIRSQERMTYTDVRRILVDHDRPMSNAIGSRVAIQANGRARVVDFRKTRKLAAI